MFSSAIQRLNDRRDAAGEIGEDAGFTLIELMVVLLIMAILLAIAIPTFLGVTKSANDRAAQSNLNTAIVNAKAAYQTNSQSYSGINAATLSSAEPSLSFVLATVAGATGSSTASGTVAIAISSTSDAVALASYSSSKNCWYEIDNTSGSTSTTAPWNATGTSAATYKTTAVTGSAVSVTWPDTAGTWYAEVKNDATTADCNPFAPVAGVGSFYTISNTAFPQL
jgi:type IV pilus assembly protein PilA